MKDLSPRHTIMAEYVALGLSNEEIAIKLDIKPASVAAAKGSPLFKAMVRDLQTRIADRMVADAADAVKADAMANVHFLRKVRDGDKLEIDYDGDDDFFKYRMDAAKTLFGSQMPKKQEVAVDTTSHILIEREDRSDLDDGAREMGVEPVRLEGPNDVDGEIVDETDDVDRRGAVKTIDEIMAEYES